LNHKLSFVILLCFLAIFSVNSTYAVDNDQNISYNTTNISNTSIPNILNTNTEGNTTFQAAGESPISFTNPQVIKSAAEVKDFLEITGTLPTLITINGTQVSQAQFLQLLTTVVLKVNNANTTSTTLIDVSLPPTGTENVNLGTLTQNEYLTIAQNILTYINTNKQAPNTANSSLGTIKFQSLIYMYTRALYMYKSTSKLPTYLSIRPWGTLPITDTSKTSITTTDVINIAMAVKGFIEVYKTLPEYINIQGIIVNQATFLQLLATTTLQLNTTTNTPLTLTNTANPTTTGTETVVLGTLNKTEYLTIAQNILTYTNNNKQAPNTANSSLGTIGFKSLIYLYSRALNLYNTNKALPTYLIVQTWSTNNIPITDTSKTSITTTDVINTAIAVKGFIEVYKTLPEYINIQGIIVNQATFLHLMVTTVININNSDSSSIGLEFVKLPDSLSENLNSGAITLNDYLQIAQNIKNYVKNNNNKAPATISTSLGNIGFQSLLYLYCRILNHQNINNQLPGLATVRGWSVTNIPIVDEFFTIQQITSVASEVKSFVDVTKSLPEYIKIGGLYVNQSQFLYLINTATLNINNENNDLIILSKATLPTVINEDMVTGSLMIDDYVELAQNIKTFIETNEKAPSGMSTSLGLVGFKSLIYMYSRALHQYNLNHALPVLITLKAWSSSNIPIYDISRTSFTLQEISNTAGEVKSFVDTTKTLPNFITISGVLLNQAQFLHLLTAATILINNKSTVSTNLFNANLPSTTNYDTLISGTMNTTSYVQLAQIIKTQIETNNRAPSNITIPLGQISFKSMVYLYSRVLNQYRLHQTLPALINVKSWSAANLPIYDDYFTNREISTTAGQVKAFVEATYSLPEYITISGVLVNQAQFLYLLTTTTLKINTNDSNSTSLQKVALPFNESENMVSGSMNLSELLQLAQNIKTYIESNQKAQGSVSGSLGEISFQTLIYTYSRVLDYYNNNNRLPSSVTNIKPWALVVYNLPSGFEIYINPSSNCQSNDARIIALANSITAGAVTPYEKALLIFNWVRDQVEYEFYYNTAKGAVGTMDSRGGNCCDIAHLIVALSRASGLAARYEHANCFFTYSQTWYGHVWAEIYVNGWVTADGSNNYNEFGIINNWDTGSFALKGTYASLPF
jgi:hypothetical protein